jgi:phospholipase C
LALFHGHSWRRGAGFRIGFIEDNWDLGRIGDQSFDALAGSVLDNFDFDSPAHVTPVLLNPLTGAVQRTR